MTRRQWLALLFTRGKPRPTPVDPNSLILDLPDDDGGARLLALEQAINFRDLGGYRTTDGRRVKWGRVFRSGTLSALSDSDLTTLRQLGVKQIFDLRSPKESVPAPDRVPEGADYVSLPVHSNTGGARQMFSLFRYYNRLEKVLFETYTRIYLERNAPVFGEILRRLAEEQGTPAVIHCTAGKDRTGIASALLLASLGVPESTIIADYSLTNRYHAPLAATIKQQMRVVERIGLNPDDMDPLLLANPETMKAALGYLQQRYGSIEAYLLQRAGIDETTLTRLRESLLE